MSAKATFTLSQAFSFGSGRSATVQAQSQNEQSSSAPHEVQQALEWIALEEAILKEDVESWLRNNYVTRKSMPTH